MVLLDSSACQKYARVEGTGGIFNHWMGHCRATVNIMHFQITTTTIFNL